MVFDTSKLRRSKSEGFRSKIAFIKTSSPFWLFQSAVGIEMAAPIAAIQIRIADWIAAMQHLAISNIDSDVAYNSS